MLSYNLVDRESSIAFRSDLSWAKPIGRGLDEDEKSGPWPRKLGPGVVEVAMAGSTEVGQSLLSKIAPLQHGSDQHQFRLLPSLILV